MKQLRKLFRTEYIGQLVERCREISQLPDLKLGELVLIAGDVQKRFSWPLGKIVDLIPRKDGTIQRVSPLELQTVNIQDTHDEPIQPGVIESDPLPTSDDVKTSGSNPLSSVSSQW